MCLCKHDHSQDIEISSTKKIPPFTFVGNFLTLGLSQMLIYFCNFKLHFDCFNIQPKCNHFICTCKIQTSCFLLKWPMFILNKVKLQSRRKNILPYYSIPYYPVLSMWLLDDYDLVLDKSMKMIMTNLYFFEIDKSELVHVFSICQFSSNLKENLSRYVIESKCLS